jgi:hypothetical protein
MKRIIGLIVFCLLYLPGNLNAGEKVIQRTKGDQSPAVNVAPGAQFNLTYGASEEIIDAAFAEIHKAYSDCLESTIAFQNKKIEDLNKKLADLYRQGHGSSLAEDAKTWVQDTIKQAPELKKEIERIDASRREYNEELSKNLMAKVYKLFAYIFETVDSTLMSFQDLNPEVKYEKDERLILFSDEFTHMDQYIARTIVLPNGNRILLNVITGKMHEGLVTTCPSMKFVEMVENKVKHTFEVVPTTFQKAVGTGGGMIIFSASGTGGKGGKVPLENEDIFIGDVEYSATGGDMLTQEFKDAFKHNFRKFFVKAYSR